MMFATLLVAEIILVTQIIAIKEGEVRLMGGSCSSVLQGRLEIYHNGIWGTVCDDGFNYEEAMVVCRQIDISYPWSDVEFYTEGKGTGQIWLDDIICQGSESSLSNCRHKSWGTNDCGHSEDVGVRCIIPNEGTLRMVGHPSGRLEIFHSGAWGTVCDDSFGVNEAKVACKQMQKRHTNAQVYAASHGNGTIWLDDVDCLGDETRLDLCTHNGWSINNCGHGEDVGIRCLGSEMSGNLRLVGDRCPHEGRLEIFHGGIWGTICDDSFTEINARVACRQLGYSPETVRYYTDGSGSGKMWLDEVIAMVQK